MAVPIIPLPFGLHATFNGLLGSQITQDFGEGVREPIELTASDDDFGFINDHGTIDPSNFIARYFYYALDFGLDTGTKVLAQGTGHVVGTSQNDVLEYTLGPSPYLGNYITIAYDNGLFATYMYLQDGSIPHTLLDIPNAQVSEGQEIGAAGFTGAATRAALHVTYGAQLVTTDTGVTMADGSLAGNPLGVPVAFRAGQLTDGVIVYSDATFAVASLGEDEATDTITFRISIINPVYDSVTPAYRIGYNTTDGTAKAGTDYASTSGQVLFGAASNQFYDIAVPMLDDTPFKPTTTFNFTITDRFGRALPSNVATGIIDTTSPFEPQSTLPVSIGGAATISTGFLLSTDPDNTADQLTYTINAAASHGTLLLNGTATASFTQSDIDSGAVQYRQNGDLAKNDSFMFTVSDPAGNKIGPEPFRIAILDQTGPVVTSNETLSLPNGSNVAPLNPFILDTVALDNTPDQMTYTLLIPPEHGLILNNGAPVSSFTQADIDNGRVMYAENRDAVRSDGFIFQVSDAAGDHTAPQPFAIHIQGSNDLVLSSGDSGTDVLASQNDGPSADHKFTFDDASTPTGADTSIAAGLDEVYSGGNSPVEGAMCTSDPTVYWLHNEYSSFGDSQS